jgi:hypothetical protein
VYRPLQFQKRSQPFHPPAQRNAFRRRDARQQSRSYRPDRFKTPGTQVNIGTKGDVFVLTEDQRHELQEITRRKLDRMNAELDEESGSAQLVPLERQALTTGEHTAAKVAP